MNNMCLIKGETVRKALLWNCLIPAVERSLGAFSRGSSRQDGAIQPLRSRISIKENNGIVLVMPGYLPKDKALATKLVTMYPQNENLGKKTHNAVVLLINADTGEMQAIIDGDAITELRTAASSGVASRHLSLKPVKKVAILGAGNQGTSHARIHHYLFKPKEMSIWSRTRSSAENLKEKLRLEGIKANVAFSVAEATNDADIINTCTFATTPILLSDYVKNGAHINAVGAPRPDWRELDDSLMKSSVVYSDSKEAALAESGDIIGSKVEVFAEIGEVINKEKEAFKGKTTIYKNLGLAVSDAISARLVYDHLYKD